MSKTIKFNLLCDGYPVRTLEELQEHFAFDDILDYYLGEGKLLSLWLKTRGYDKELRKVEEIKSTDRREILVNLVRIFGIDKDEDDVDAFLRSEAYTKEKSQRNENVEALDNATLLNSYRQGYEQQLQLLESKDQKERKEAIKAMQRDYSWAFELGFESMIKQLKAKRKMEAVIDIISVISMDSKIEHLIMDKDRRIKYDLYDWLVSEGAFRKRKTKSCELNGGECKKVEAEGKCCLITGTNSSTALYINNFTLETGQIFNGLDIKNNRSVKREFSYIILNDE